MKTNKLLIAGLMSLSVSNICLAEMTDIMGEIYDIRCANCHGVTANGVPKMEEQYGIKADIADHQGVASEEKINIYGPPLRYYSEDELIYKLKDLRNKDFDAESSHSVMQENLKKIEEREGRISDKKMAQYIYNTFGVD